VIDPVSEELERRAVISWPWRSALLAALVVHIATAGAVLLAARTHRRPLLLPSVQVRLGVVAPAPATAPAGAPAPARAPARPAPRPPAKSAPTAPRASHGVAARSAPTAVPVAQQAGDAEGTTAADGPAIAAAVAGGGGLAARLDAGGGGEPFPYDYYLQRLLGAIEANWFRPPAPDGTRCRVLCRIDRGARLVETGIEAPSAVSAFDRAALRAVYAAAPFPPLPQGFGGTTLTLHLDFGP
jgi:TonB family protein